MLSAISRQVWENLFRICLILVYVLKLFSSATCCPFEYLYYFYCQFSPFQLFRCVQIWFVHKLGLFVCVLPRNEDFFRILRIASQLFLISIKRNIGYRKNIIGNSKMLCQFLYERYILLVLKYLTLFVHLFLIDNYRQHAYLINKKLTINTVCTAPHTLLILF